MKTVIKEGKHYGKGSYKEIGSNKKYISIKNKIMFDEDGHTIWIIY